MSYFRNRSTIFVKNYLESIVWTTIILKNAYMEMVL